MSKAMIQRQEEAQWVSGIEVAQCGWSTEEEVANSRKWAWELTLVALVDLWLELLEILRLIWDYNYQTIFVYNR